MPGKRLRQAGPAIAAAAAVLALTACGVEYPNSTFNHTTDLNTAIDALWNRLLLLGTIVFVFVEVLLLITVVKFRRREGAPAPKQVHGNAALEITWTAIPALILALIAVPTVRTIFKTQAKAPAGSLEVQVIGHQWWWEFRYPQYGVVTANELYLPAGRSVSFALTTRDVIHSFWAPQLGGKRDLISNRTNYLWYTPNASLAENVFNGFCTEYCGASHANMRLRVYTVAPDKFASWIAHQRSPSALAPAAPVVAQASVVSLPGAPVPAPVPAPAPATEGYVFPADKLPPYAIPTTPLPPASALPFDDALLTQADAERGRALVTNLAKAPCLTCHNIRGEMQLLTDDLARGPNLTHFASRHTFAGGVYAVDARALARWIKDAPLMKPGSIMPTLGTGMYNPQMKMTVTAGGLDDRQIADIVAYLMALK